MSNLTSMSKKDTAPKSGEDEKVNWFAELRGLALMLLTGPILAWIVTGGETPYRVLRATAPWKYLGFALGGTVMTFGLIALSQHRPSWRLAALAFVATLVIALLYDLPFDNLLLPPNGDF